MMMRRILSILIVVATLFATFDAVFAQTATDLFDRASLGTSWQAAATIGISNGRLHNTATVSAWNYLATSNGNHGGVTVANPNEISMTWAAEPFCTVDGAKSSGLAVGLSAFSATANGYFIYERNGNVILYSISNGTIPGGSSAIATKPRVTGAPASGPGKTLKCIYDKANYRFYLYIDNVLLTNGPLEDTRTTGRHNYTTHYCGILLLGNIANDIESYTAAVAGDMTAPSAVTNLAASNPTVNSIKLNWTAVGNNGNTGTATTYDIRYSLSTITEGTSWTNATQVTGEPVPTAAGTNQTFTVTGLAANTTYHFAMKVADGVPNWSAISTGDPSAKTLESGGGPTELLAYTDNFDRTSIGSDWAVTVDHEIKNGTLGLKSTASAAWNYLATFIKSPVGLNPAGVSMQFDPVESVAGLNGTGTGGLAVLLNAPSSTASGYLILLRSKKVNLYNVVNGSATGSISSVNNKLAADPVPGDIVKVLITIETTKQTFDVYVNDASAGTLIVNTPTHNPTNWYTGVMQVGTYKNNITAFSVYYQGAGEPARIVKHYGDGQSGPIFSQLPDSVAVKVTDLAGTPFEGTVVDFQVIQGKAALSIDDFEFDGLIWKECENGTVVSPAVTEQDAAASGGMFVMTPYVDGNYGKGRTIMSIYVPEAGSYDLYLRMICPSSNSNSLFFKIDNADSIEYKFTISWSAWLWKAMRSNITLDKGFHKVSILTREPGVKFDKIVLNNRNINTSWQPPNTVGGTGPILPNMSDAQGIAYTFVTFDNDADNDVILHAIAYKNDGTTLLEGAPVIFTLNPTPGAAVTIEKDAALPDPLIGPPGAEMPTPLRAIIKDQYGNRVPGVTVTWSITQGEGGKLKVASSVSNAQGAAETYLTLSLTTASYTVQGAAGSLNGSPVSFHVVPGNPPERISLIGPKKSQTAFAGSIVDSLLTVKVVDNKGAAFKDYPVEFVVTAGSGSISAPAGAMMSVNEKSGKNSGEVEAETNTIITTDANGIARAQWSLGRRVGLNTAEARATLTGSPISFSAMGQLGEAAKLVIVSGDDQTGPVGLVLREPFVVKVTDLYDNPIPNKAIRFIVDQGTGAYFDQAGVLEKTVYTNSEGKASISLRMGSLENEEHLVRAIVVGTQVPSVFFSATSTAAIACCISYQSGNGVQAFGNWVYQDTTVTKALKQPFVVKVVGPFGKAVALHPVTFTVIAGGGNISGQQSVTVPTNSDGIASVTLTLGTLAGDSVHVVEANSFRIDLPTQQLDGAPVTFKATGNPKPAAKLVMDITSNNQIGPVGQPLPKPIQVSVTDLHGNIIMRHLVTFEVQGDGGLLQDDMGFDKSKEVQTRENGYASIVWHMPQKPSIYTLLAKSTTTTGDQLTGSPATFTGSAREGNPDSLFRTTPGGVLSGIVNKALPERIKVKVVDKYMNSIAGYPVTFQVKTGNGTVNGASQVTSTTNSFGEASVEWVLGSVKGIENNSVQVTASVPNGSTLLFVASAGNDVAYALKSDQTHLNGEVGNLLAEPISVQIVDKFNNGVPSHPVNFSIVEEKGNIGYIFTPGQITADIMTNENGQAQVEWGLGPNPGSINNKLVASSKYNNISLQGSPREFTASALSGVPDSLIKITDDKNLSVVVGNPVPGDLRVKVTDRFGNPLARQKVTFTVISRNQAGGGSIDGKIDSVKIKETNSSGVASIQFYTGRIAGNKINKIHASALYEGQELIGSPVLFEITGLYSDAKRIEISDGDLQAGVVGKVLPRTIKVIAYDKDRNRVKNQPIRFAIVATGKTGNIGSLGAGATIDTTMNTNSDGIAQVQWRLGHKVGTYKLEASSIRGDVQLDNSPLFFTATADADISSPDSSEIAIFPTQVMVSDGNVVADVTITLQDQYGNPVKDKVVMLEATGDLNYITQPAKTNSYGQTIGKIASRRAGIKVVTAKDIISDVTLASTAIVTFIPGNAAQLSKPQDSGDSQTSNAGTVLPKPLRVMITDSYGNMIPYYTVSFIVTQGNGQILNTQTVFTDSTGIASARFVLGAEVGLNRVQVRAEGLNGSPQDFNLFGIQHGQLSTLEKVAGDNKAACPGDELPEQLCVILKDIIGWPVWGESVKFTTVLNDGLIMSENPINTDKFGMACARANVGTKVGPNVFQATLPSNPGIVATFYDTTRACNATQLEVYSGNEQNGTVKFTLPLPLCVRTTDQYNNPVGGVGVTFSVVDDISVNSVGYLENNQRAVSKISNSQGIACVYYTMGNAAGINKVRVRGSGLKPNFVEFTLHGNAGAPYNMEYRSGDGQRGEMGKEVLKPICVTIKDANGNPTSGGYVEFYVTKGGGEIVDAMPVPSDASGCACARWQLGPRPIGTDNRAEVLSTNLAGGSFKKEFKAVGDASSWPDFVLPDRIEAYENSLVTFPVYAAEEDGDYISYTVVSMPDTGATFTMNSITGHYEFRWTPDYNTVKVAGQSKTYYPTFRAEDQAGFDVDSVEVVIRNVNRPPMIQQVIPSLFDIIYNQGQELLSFNVNAIDPDSDPIFFKWTVNGRFVSSAQRFDMILANYPTGMKHYVKIEVCDQESCTSHEWRASTEDLVEMKSMSCVAVPYQGVTLTWETATEVNNAGFNVLRSFSENGQYAQINEKMIAANHEKVYSYSDKIQGAGRRYYYKIEDVNKWGLKTQHGPVAALIELPKNFELSQNYPNPFNPTTSIRFQLPRVSQVKLEIFNIRGELVRTLVDGSRDAGYHVVIWDSCDEGGLRVGSGIYYYRFVTPDFTEVKKMAFLK